MKNFIYHRVFGNIATIVLHVGNLAFIVKNLEEKLPMFPDLEIYQRLQHRYLTVWNVLFQIFYASMSLFIELMTLIGKEDAVPKRLTKFRSVFFRCIVHPFTMLVYTLFWPLYFYDRELVFPSRTDIFVSKTCTHILHTFILLVILWELAFQQRNIVTSHKKNCWYIFVMYCIYNAVLFYTKYGDIGLWPYGILHVLEGTIFFSLFFLYILVALYTSYFLQSRMQTGLWALRERISMKKHIL